MHQTDHCSNVPLCSFASSRRQNLSVLFYLRSECAAPQKFSFFSWWLKPLAKPFLTRNQIMEGQQTSLNCVKDVSILPASFSLHSVDFLPINGKHIFLTYEHLFMYQSTAVGLCLHTVTKLALWKWGNFERAKHTLKKW